MTTFVFWQQAALVLNASRRFRYTLDLKREEEKETLRRKIRAHAQVIRVLFLLWLSDFIYVLATFFFFFFFYVLNLTFQAALLFKEAGEAGEREKPGNNWTYIQIILYLDCQKYLRTFSTMFLILW